MLNDYRKALRMRIPIKVVLISTCVVYSGVVTKIACEQHKQIDILEKKLKKSKKKFKRFKKEFLKPPYMRSRLPRNGKFISYNKPKHPIGFM